MASKKVYDTFIMGPRGVFVYYKGKTFPAGKQAKAAEAVAAETTAARGLVAVSHSLPGKKGAKKLYQVRVYEVRDGVASTILNSDGVDMVITADVLPTLATFLQTRQDKTTASAAAQSSAAQLDSLASTVAAASTTVTPPAPAAVAAAVTSAAQATRKAAVDMGNVAVSGSVISRAATVANQRASDLQRLAAAVAAGQVGPAAATAAISATAADLKRAAVAVTLPAPALPPPPPPPPPASKGKRASSGKGNGKGRSKSKSKSRSRSRSSSPTRSLTSTVSASPPSLTLTTAADAKPGKAKTIRTTPVSSPRRQPSPRAVGPPVMSKPKPAAKSPGARVDRRATRITIPAGVKHTYAYWEKMFFGRSDVIHGGHTSSHTFEEFGTHLRTRHPSAFPRGLWTVDVERTQFVLRRKPKRATSPKGKAKRPPSPKGKAKRPPSPKGKAKRPPSPKGKAKRPASPKGKAKRPASPKGKAKRPASPKGKAKRPASPRAASPAKKRAVKRFYSILHGTKKTMAQWRRFLYGRSVFRAGESDARYNYPEAAELLTAADLRLAPKWMPVPSGDPTRIRFARTSGARPGYALGRGAVTLLPASPKRKRPTSPRPKSPRPTSPKGKGTGKSKPASPKKKFTRPLDSYAHFAKLMRGDSKALRRDVLNHIQRMRERGKAIDIRGAQLTRNVYLYHRVPVDRDIDDYFGSNWKAYRVRAFNTPGRASSAFAFIALPGTKQVVPTIARWVSAHARSKHAKRDFYRTYLKDYRFLTIRGPRDKQGYVTVNVYEAKPGKTTTTLSEIGRGKSYKDAPNIDRTALVRKVEF